MTRRPAITAAGLALFAAALAAFLSKRVFEGIPHVSDAVSYAFEGRILASGRLYLPPPPVGEAFAAQNASVSNGSWTADQRSSSSPRSRRTTCTTGRHRPPAS